MNPPHDRTGLAAALLTVPAWGMTGIFVRLLPGLSPVFVTAGRLLLALAALLPVLVFAPSLRRALLSAARMKAAWGLSAFMVTYYAAAVAAYQLAPVGEVALSLATTPLFVLAAQALRGERVYRHELAGAIVALIGVAVIVLPNLMPGGGVSGARILGQALGLTSSAAAAFYALGFRTLGRRNAAPDATGVALMAFVVGGFGLALLMPLLGIPFNLDRLSRESLMVLAGLALFSTLMPSITYGISSIRLEPIVTTTIRLLIPIAAAIAAAVILGEMPSWWVLPGGAMIIGGIYHTTRPYSSRRV